MLDSFWMSDYGQSVMHQRSEVDALLEKGNCTLEELFDKEELLQQCSNKNPILIEFLEKSENIKKLILYITRPSDENIEMVQKQRNSIWETNDNNTDMNEENEQNNESNTTTNNDNNNSTTTTNSNDDNDNDNDDNSINNSESRPEVSKESKSDIGDETNVDVKEDSSSKGPLLDPPKNDNATLQTKQQPNSKKKHSKSGRHHSHRKKGPKMLVYSEGGDLPPPPPPPAAESPESSQSDANKDNKDSNDTGDTGDTGDTSDITTTENDKTTENETNIDKEKSGDSTEDVNTTDNDKTEDTTVTDADSNDKEESKDETQAQNDTDNTGKDESKEENSDDKPKKIDNSETSAADATEAKVPQSLEDNTNNKDSSESADDADTADPEIPDDLDVLKANKSRDEKPYQQNGSISGTDAESKENDTTTNNNNNNNSETTNDINSLTTDLELLTMSSEGDTNNIDKEISDYDSEGGVPGGVPTKPGDRDPLTEMQKTQIRLKYPYLASEILNCQIGGILDAILDSTNEYLDLLFDFIEKDAPLDAVLTNYWRSCIVGLVRRNSGVMLEYIKTRSNVLKYMVKHIRDQSIMELVIALGWDPAIEELKELDDVADWMYEEGLVPKLIAMLSPDHSSDEHSAASYTLVDIVAKTSRSTNLVLFRNLSSEDEVNALMSHMFENNRSSLLESLSVLLALLHHYPNARAERQMQMESGYTPMTNDSDVPPPPPNHMNDDEDTSSDEDNENLTPYSNNSNDENDKTPDNLKDDNKPIDFPEFNENIITNPLAAAALKKQSSQDNLDNQDSNTPETTDTNTNENEQKDSKNETNDTNDTNDNNDTTTNEKTQNDQNNESNENSKDDTTQTTSNTENKENTDTADKSTDNNKTEQNNESKPDTTETTKESNENEKDKSESNDKVETKKDIIVINNNNNNNNNKEEKEEKHETEIKPGTSPPPPPPGHVPPPPMHDIPDEHSNPQMFSNPLAAAAAAAQRNSPDRSPIMTPTASDHITNDFEAKENDSLPSVVRVVCEKLEDFKTLLETAPNETLNLPFCTLDPPLGPVRHKIIDMIVALMRTPSTMVSQKLRDLNFIQLCIDLFFDYPWNNLLHGSVEHIVQMIVSGDCAILKQALFEDCKFLDRILDARNSSKLHREQHSFRLGFMGHLTRIANTIVEFSKRNSMLNNYMNESDRWMEFIEGDLRLENEKLNTQLGGHRPSALDDGVDDEFLFNLGGGGNNNNNNTSNQDNDDNLLDSNGNNNNKSRPHIDDTELLDDELGAQLKTWDDDSDSDSDNERQENDSFGQYADYHNSNNNNNNNNKSPHSPNSKTPMNINGQNNTNNSNNNNNVNKTDSENESGNDSSNYDSDHSSEEEEMVDTAGVVIDERNGKNNNDNNDAATKQNGGKDANGGYRLPSDELAADFDESQWDTFGQINDDWAKFDENKDGGKGDNNENKDNTDNDNNNNNNNNEIASHLFFDSGSKEDQEKRKSITPDTTEFDNFGDFGISDKLNNNEKGADFDDFFGSQNDDPFGTQPEKDKGNSTSQPVAGDTNITDTTNDNNNADDKSK